MPRTVPTASFVLAAAFWLAPPAPAQMIVQYNFDNTTTTSTAADPSSTNPNATGFTTVSGPNLVQDFSIPDYGQQVLRAAIMPTGTPDETAAVTAGSYWSFTVQPNAGFRMNLTNLTFDAARGGAATPRSWHLYSSVGGFTPGSAIASAEVLTARPTLSPFSVTLSGAQFQGLINPVEFRMYNSSPAAGQSIEFDNLTLNGTVVLIPEPTCMLGLAACAGGFWTLRRRRSQNSAQVSVTPSSCI